MLLIEREILGYLNDNWTQPPTIAWTNFNVSVNYQSDQDYLVPFIRNLDSVILEIPANRNKFCEYLCNCAVESL
jgi:small-conductance mechanosensitive channel